MADAADMILFLERLIYGPRLIKTHSGAEVMRPTAVDMDTVREIGSMAAEIASELPHLEDDSEPIGPTVYVTSPTRPGTVTRIIQPEELNDISPDERSRIIVRNAVGRRNVTIPFIRNTLSGNNVNVSTRANNIDPAIIEQARARILDKLFHDGRPVFIWHRLIPATYYAPIAIAAGLWLWTTLLVPLPPPAWLLGWLILLGGVILTRKLAHASYWTDPENWPAGNRIIGETRATTQERRADRRANIKTALITAAITAPISFAVALALAYFTNAWGLRG